MNCSYSLFYILSKIRKKLAVLSSHPRTSNGHSSIASSSSKFAEGQWNDPLNARFLTATLDIMIVVLLKLLNMTIRSIKCHNYLNGPLSPAAYQMRSSASRPLSLPPKSATLYQSIPHMFGETADNALRALSTLDRISPLFNAGINKSFRSFHGR